MDLESRKWPPTCLVLVAVVVCVGMYDQSSPHVGYPNWSEKIQRKSHDIQNKCIENGHNVQNRCREKIIMLIKNSEFCYEFFYELSKKCHDQNSGHVKKHNGNSMIQYWIVKTYRSGVVFYMRLLWMVEYIFIEWYSKLNFKWTTAEFSNDIRELGLDSNHLEHFVTMNKTCQTDFVKAILPRIDYEFPAFFNDSSVS